MSAQLFSALKIREIGFKNRIFVSPMCQYSAIDGVPNDWHFVHLGTRAVGGAALVVCEATAVNAEGRISPGDTGLWNDRQVEAFARINRFIHDNGACTGVQLAHAGRKASTGRPWEGGQAVVGSEAWEPVAPSAIAFSPTYPQPRELSVAGIQQIVADFASAARRGVAAGFDVIELHFAHGYLVHEFLSPLSNQRTDHYGGVLENRTRFALEIARAVRAVWPAKLPLFARVSATDWVAGGWDLEQTIELARGLKESGVDLVDCSSGGLVANAQIPVGPGYQVPLAEGVRQGAGIATAAVGLITEPQQAEDILTAGRADAIFLARELLRDPYWPLHAARTLGVEIEWPKQYARAKRG